MNLLKTCVLMSIFLMFMLTGCGSNRQLLESTQAISSRSELSTLQPKSNIFPTTDSIVDTPSAISLPQQNNAYPTAVENTGSFSLEQQENAYPPMNTSGESISPSPEEKAYPQPITPNENSIQGAYPAPSKVVDTVSPVITSRASSTPISKQQNPEILQQTSTVSTVTPQVGAAPSPLPMVKAYLEATDPKTVKLASGKAQLIEFFAFWDPFSKSMATVVHSLDTQYHDYIRFIYLDIDDPDNKPFKSALGVKYPPQFILLNKEGEVLQRWVGIVTKEEFEIAFASLP